MIKSPIVPTACLSALVFTIPTNALNAAETKSLQYDALGRLVTSAATGGPASGQQTTVTYDPAGNRSNYAMNVGGGGAPPPPPPPPPPNSPPIANADSASLICWASTTLNLVANDTDPDGHYPLSITGANGSAALSVSGVDSTTVQIDASGVRGTFNLTYTIQDSLGASATGALTVTVSGSASYCDNGPY